jgi:L-glutamine-phosphate cytidylyltransferase
VRAIILAAGRGSRMGGLTEDRPKCLVELNGRPLLELQLEALRKGGVDRIAIATGWQSQLITNRGLETFHNPRWAETNMVRTLQYAGSWLKETACIVSYSDIFYSPFAVSDLVVSRADIAITYDPDWLKLWARRFSDPLADAETFDLDGKGNVIKIGEKTDNIQKIKGQYMGLLKFTPKGWTWVMDAICEMSAQAQDKLDMTSLLRKLISLGLPIEAIPVQGAWGEIDSESDLALFESIKKRKKI